MRIDDSELWYAFEERAAIMEYDGGLSRPEAEARAAELLNLKPMAGRNLPDWRI